MADRILGLQRMKGGDQEGWNFLVVFSSPKWRNPKSQTPGTLHHIDHQRNLVMMLKSSDVCCMLARIFVEKEDTASIYQLNLDETLRPSIWILTILAPAKASPVRSRCNRNPFYWHGAVIFLDDDQNSVKTQKRTCCKIKYWKSSTRHITKHLRFIQTSKSTFVTVRTHKTPQNSVNYKPCSPSLPFHSHFCASAEGWWCVGINKLVTAWDSVTAWGCLNRQSLEAEQNRQNKDVCQFFRKFS